MIHATNLFTALNIIVSYLQHWGYKGRLCNHVLLKQRVFTPEKLTRRGLEGEKGLRLSPMSPFTHHLLLLILASTHTHTKHVQQWSSFTLKMPAVTDLRKQNMACSCKWAQKTYKLGRWNMKNVTRVALTK